MKKVFFAILVVLLAMGSVFAQGATDSAAAATPKWPEQPITIINQSAAGSGPDLVVREIAPLLQKELGTKIIPDNKAGSGGKLACDYVWGSAADGYTLLAHSSPLTTTTQISKNAEYSIKDMKHIVAWDAAPYSVIVKANSPINTVEDLIEYCKNNKASNANSGIGGAMYLQSRIMAEALGIDYDEVPYNGSAPCVTAVMSGDTTFTVTSYDAAANNPEVKVICLLSDQRISFMPDVPAITESGYSFAFMTMVRGILAPKDTPDYIVEKLIAAFKVAFESEQFKQYAEAAQLNLAFLYGEDYRKLDEQYYEDIMKFKDYL